MTTKTGDAGTVHAEPVNWWTTPARAAAIARARDLGSGSDAKRLRGLVAARRRGSDWLLARMRPDGALGDPAAGFEYYRAPWTFGLVGEVNAAHAVCGFVRRNLLTSDGRLDGPLRVAQTDWAYRDATFILGAHQIGEYDLSYGLFDELLRWQDPASGAFANDRLPDGSMSDDMDIPYACGPGFTALALGRLEVARRVAGFLRMIWDAQTLDAAGGLPSRFYCMWSRSRQRTIVPSDPDFREDMVVDNAADRMQRWTIGGISAGLLCRLYLADPDPAYIELARRYQAFSMAATDAQFGYPSVCKTSWGSSLLFQVTDEASYRDWTLRLGDWYVATQEEEGYWHPWVERIDGDRIWLTLEYVMHLDTIIAALASRPPD